MVEYLAILNDFNNASKVLLCTQSEMRVKYLQITDLFLYHKPALGLAVDNSQQTLNMNPVKHIGLIFKYTTNC